MSLAKVQNFSISLDGFGTGEGLSREHPFGHAGERLHEWMFETRWWRKLVGKPGGSRGIDDALVRQYDIGIGAEIMGAGKFGYPGWQDDPDWSGTTFHFVDASPADALAMACDAAKGQDVRIGGGVSVVREFFAAGLVDHAHIVVVPILLGRGVRVWDGLEALEQSYEIEAASSPSGVTHLTFTRRGL